MWPCWKQQGSITLMAGGFLVAAVVLTVGTLSLGMLVMHRLQLRHAADAVAMAGVLQTRSYPAPNFGGPLFQPQDFVENPNALSDQIMDMTELIVPSGSGYQPVTTSVGMYGQHPPLMSWMLPKTLYASALAFVHQYQVQRFALLKPRVILLLDYSRSMRLAYEGGDPIKDAAINVLRGAVGEVLRDADLQQRVDWGLLTFGETVFETLHAEISSPEHVRALISMLNQPTQGDPTDIASAVDKATQMLSSGSGHQAKVMILVTDGEPDMAPGLSLSEPYELRVAQAEQAAQAKIFQAWKQNIRTISVHVQRQSALETNAEDFLKSIAGYQDPKTHAMVSDPHSYLAADSIDALYHFFADLNVSNPCESETLDRRVPQAYLPWRGDIQTLKGFWVPNEDQPSLEFPVKRVQDDAALEPSNLNGLDMHRIPAAFYYDLPNRRLVVNTPMCLAWMNQPHSHFRIRWGMPRLGMPKAGGSGPP